MNLTKLFEEQWLIIISNMQIETTKIFSRLTGSHCCHHVARAAFARDDSQSG